VKYQIRKILFHVLLGLPSCLRFEDRAA